MTIRTILLIFFLSSSACASAVENQANSLPLFIVHFETGGNWDPSLGPSEQDGFADHSQNLQQLRREGTIVFGARYGDLGLIILQHPSLQTATELIASDPGIRSEIFVFRIEALAVFYNWQD